MQRLKLTPTKRSLRDNAHHSSGPLFGKRAVSGLTSLLTSDGIGFQKEAVAIHYLILLPMKLEFIIMRQWYDSLRSPCVVHRALLVVVQRLS